MAVRKYIFWLTKKGVKTYKVEQKGKFDLVPYRGDEYYPGTDFEDFAKWFQKTAAIRENEYIDFCYLSDTPIDSSLFDFQTSEKSSWDKGEIDLFCKKEIRISNYEVYYSESKCFVCQNVDIYPGQTLKKLYVKCVPDFSIETIEEEDTGSEKTSILNRFYMSRLKEIGGK